MIFMDNDISHQNTEINPLALATAKYKLGEIVIQSDLFIITPYIITSCILSLNFNVSKF